MSLLFNPWVFPHPFLQIPIASLVSQDGGNEGAIDLSKKSSLRDDTSSGPPSPSSIRTSDDDGLSSSSGSKSYSKEESEACRDEKRAKQLKIPISLDDIINLPMDEFNERLSKYELNEAQLSLIRDIRRRGKNKVAAQNCRKRKLDQILSLADEVNNLRSKRDRVAEELEDLIQRRHNLTSRYTALYRHISEHLRDSDGKRLNPYEFVLEHSGKDARVAVVPIGSSRAAQIVPGRSRAADESSKSRDLNRSREVEDQGYVEGENSARVVGGRKTSRSTGQRRDASNGDDS